MDPVLLRDVSGVNPQRMLMIIGIGYSCVMNALKGMMSIGVTDGMNTIRSACEDKP